MFAMATTSASGFDCKQHQQQLTCNGCKATATVMTIQNLDFSKYQLIPLESVDIHVILLHERETTTSLKNN
jgi:copper(I)-binding protein